jgi:hypothetical protein
MPRLLRYLGGAGEHLEITVGDKTYQFTSPKARYDPQGNRLPGDMASKPVAVNNDHLEEVTTYPYARFEEVTEPATPAPQAPAQADVQATAQAGAKEK